MFKEPTAMARAGHSRGLFSGLMLALACGLALLSSLTAWGAAAGPAGAEAAPVVLADAVRLVEFGGRVEVGRGRDGRWEPAQTNQVLVPGDRVRTSPNSRATLQFSDRSVFRLNQSSLLEIRPKSPASGLRALFLRIGELFFLDRERPARVEVQTPTSTSAIRGTEFILAAEGQEGATRLAMLDGTVAMSAAGVEVEVHAGQSATVEPAGPPVVRPLVEARSRIQWALHYPGVLVPEDLAFTEHETTVLAPAVERYRAGDILGALAALPGDRDGDGAPVSAFSGDASLFAAGLRLAVGQAGELERVLAEPGILDRPAGRALQTLLAAVRQEEIRPEPEAGAGSASEALAASYYWQSRSDLERSRRSAERAVERAPDSGFAWVRQAEMEWAAGWRRPALASLERGRELSPKNPMGHVVAGFIELERGRGVAARDHFEAARGLDGSLAEAWLGLGLAMERLGDREGALTALQVAATVEPRRAVVRSYLGKVWAAADEATLADEEFGLALGLDPEDPTAWLYRGLHRQQTHRLNESVDDLRESVARNDSRSVFRSSLLLDGDRAMRQADLSISYAAVGLGDWAARTASRAIADDYADFAGHLFRARTIQRQLEDPAGFETRHEAARQSHLLIANLLAPPEGANLSLTLSQQDHLRPFDRGSVHGTSLTEYRSSGDWSETATLFGTVGRMGYALDGRYLTSQGDRANATREEASVSVQAKQGVGDRDEVYVQAGGLQRKGDDLSRLYDPTTSVTGYRFEETELPSAYLGWHREWHPGSHTLALASFLDDELEILNPEPQVLFLRQRSGQARGLELDPFFDFEGSSRFRLFSMELQQIWQTERHGLVAGVRYQHGDFEIAERLVRTLGAPMPGVAGVPDTSAAGGYAYYTFAPMASLRLTAGVAYDDLRFPSNATWPPAGNGEAHETQWSPKLGVRWSTWKGGFLRGTYTRSLGGPEFAQSLRLEPVEVGSFTQAYRNIAPASVAGVLTGMPQEVAGIGFDQEFVTRTFVGITAERLATEGERQLGVVRNTSLLPIPDATGQLGQEVEFREDTLTVYGNQLLGRWWAAGVRYSLSRAELETAFPGLPVGLPGVAGLSADETSILGTLRFHLAFNHGSGFFSHWVTEFLHQHNAGYAVERPDEAVWQHDVWVGYRFPRRRAEIRLGIVNLTDQDPRLSPLNEFRPRSRERTFEAAVRIQF